jgi:hypothetical protein
LQQLAQRELAANDAALPVELAPAVHRALAQKRGLVARPGTRVQLEVGRVAKAERPVHLHFRQVRKPKFAVAREGGAGVDAARRPAHLQRAASHVHDAVGVEGDGVYRGGVVAG